VEDARAAPRGVEERGAVEEVAPEHAQQAALAGPRRQRVEVVRLRLVICTSPAHDVSDRQARRQAEDQSLDGISANGLAASKATRHS
jgi:hypothetical protein